MIVSKASSYALATSSALYDAGNDAKLFESLSTGTGSHTSARMDNNKMSSLTSGACVKNARRSMGSISASGAFKKTRAFKLSSKGANKWSSLRHVAPKT